MRTLLFLATAVLVLEGSELRADEVAIIKKAIKAHGGEKNLARFLRCEIEKKGTATIDGQTYPFIATLTAGTGKFEELASLYTPRMFGVGPTLFMSIRNRYTGEKGQFVVSSLVFKEDRIANTSMLKEYRAMAHEREVCLLTPLLRDREYKLSVLRDDRATVVVRIERKGEKRIDLTFDKMTRQLTQSAREYYDFATRAEGKQVTSYKNFKKVHGAGVRYAFTVRHDGKLFLEGEVKTITPLKKEPEIEVKD
jgi:hypothetical protein